MPFQLERGAMVAPVGLARPYSGLIRDARLTYLAERLIYEEWPAVLPLETRNRIDAERHDRHLTLIERPWTTVSAALEAIDELLPDADDSGREILVEYQRYLRGLARPEASPPYRSIPPFRCIRARRWRCRHYEWC